jgi:uncharacterized membrane protein
MFDRLLSARFLTAEPGSGAAFLACVSAALALAFASPAGADFRLCNNTGARVGVAIGYKDATGWATEGWWNLSPRSCETLLRGTLVARFYYIYAVDYDHGGEWSGKAFMCTREKEFTIRGAEDCLARGYDRTGFFEVDTAEQQTWTVQLTEASDQAAQRPAGPGAPLLAIPPAQDRPDAGAGPRSSRRLGRPRQIRRWSRVCSNRAPTCSAST